MTTQQVEIGLLMPSWVDAVAFDPRLRTCAVTLTGLAGAGRISHVVEGRGVRLFRSYSNYSLSADADAVLEATQVFLYQEVDDLRLFIECWGPDAAIEVLAKEFSLDGAALTPESAAAIPVPPWATRDIRQGWLSIA